MYEEGGFCSVAPCLVVHCCSFVVNKKDARGWDVFVVFTVFDYRQFCPFVLFLTVGRFVVCFLGSWGSCVLVGRFFHWIGFLFAGGGFRFFVRCPFGWDWYGGADGCFGVCVGLFDAFGCEVFHYAPRVLFRVLCFVDEGAYGEEYVVKAGYFVAPVERFCFYVVSCDGYDCVDLKLWVFFLVVGGFLPHFGVVDFSEVCVLGVPFGCEDTFLVDTVVLV